MAKKNTDFRQAGAESFDRRHLGQRIVKALAAAQRRDVGGEAAARHVKLDKRAVGARIT